MSPKCETAKLNPFRQFKRPLTMAVFILGFHLLPTACATLKPVDRPAEYAPPTADTQSWRVLTGESSDDCFA
jgi:hypothetical protein